MMTHTQQIVWEKLLAFELDRADASYPFSARLAKENNWSMTFTEQAITEYKKFMFLATFADHMVSPSEVIDEVWHLHLIYTQSYWKDLCEGVLGKRIEHIPSSGGREQQAYFEDLRAKTRESYIRFFGEEPPAEIWEEQADLQPISSGLRPWQKMLDTQPALGVLLILLLSLTLGTALATTVLMAVKGGSFLWIFILSAIGSLFVGSALKRFYEKELLQDREALIAIEKLNPYEVAYLRTNEPKHITNTLIAKLLDLGFISKAGESDSKLKLVGNAQSEDKLNPLEKTFLQRLRQRGEAATPTELHEGLIQYPVFQQTIRYVQGFKENIAQLPDSFNARWMPLALNILVLGVGIGRMMVGIMREKPVGFLFLLCLVFVGIIYYVWKQGNRNLYQTQITDYLKTQKGDMQTMQNRREGDWGMSLYGNQYYGGYFPYFIPIYMPTGSSGDGTSFWGGSDTGGGDGGGSDGGSGCGGGDSGCGGGGCGGCGGGD